MKFIHGKRKYLFWLSLLMLAGCQTAALPEIRPFADKTTEMAAAMNAGYAEAGNLLTQANDLQDAKRLQERWEPTRKAFGALVAYSDALAAIADAGDRGSDSAQAVAASLNGLIGAINPLVGVAQLPAQAVKTMEALYGYVARVKARKSMAQAVAEAQPAIDQIAELMAQNFTSLAQLHASAGMERERLLVRDNQTLINFHRSLTRQSEKIIPALTSLYDYQNEASAEALNDAMALDEPLKREIERACATGPIAACKNAPAIAENRQHQLLAKWRALQDDLKRVAPEYDAYLAREAALKGQVAEGRLIIEKSREAILAWRDAHAQIRLALEQKQRLTIQQLAAIVKEMADIYRKGSK